MPLKTADFGDKEGQKTPVPGDHGVALPLSYFNSHGRDVEFFLFIGDFI